MQKYRVTLANDQVVTVEAETADMAIRLALDKIDIASKIKKVERS